MFLKSIELFGFKSFADRCRLDFTDGVSALLGPNGCGKSNVVDAIKWVLGEQATRSLRAERMEDVIFNGTENRKPLNVAEVTLTLANDEGILPIDQSEIAVRRRLYRSGDSEYYINNTPVKLRELRELFYDTGIGKSAYSIMEQGKIDQVLSNKPEERRTIFEEAATITRYRHKGQEAERKLAKTEENVRQVESILAEVTRTYNTLEKQAKKTERFRELKSRLFDLELDRELLKLRKLLEDRDSREKRLKEASDKRDGIRARIDSANETVETSLDEVNEMESSLVAKQKELYGIEIERGNVDGRINMLEERRSELEEKIESDKKRESTIKERIRSGEQDITQREHHLQELSTRLTDIQKNITEFRGHIDAAQERIKANNTAAKDKRSRIQQLETETEELSGELRSLTDTIVSELDTRLRESGYRTRDHQQRSSELDAAVAGLARGITAKRQNLEDRLRTAGNDPDTLGALVQSTLEGLDEIGTASEEVKSALAAFRETIPSFLDEFLAPEGTLTRKREIDRRTDEIRQQIRTLREEIEVHEGENRDLNEHINEYRSTLEQMRMNEVQVQTQSRAESEATERARRDLAEQQQALAELNTGIEQSHQRVQEFASQIKQMHSERENLGKQEKNLKKELAQLEKGISQRNEQLAQRERAVKAMMNDLAKAQTDVEKLQVQKAEINTEIRSIYDNFRDRHSRELSEFETRMFEIPNEPKELREKIALVRDEQKSLGSVNLMAPEEFAEVKERYDFLNSQLNDLKHAKEDLLRVTEEIRKESTELFLRTYEKIKRNFHNMFRRLFGGGRAELRLLDPDNPLESGIDILAQPPGKKLENIALLSGGERSMTGVAL
ncbi:MAG: chromosome segregation SMC family protein, partial [Spirochaetota bacterium]